MQEAEKKKPEVSLRGRDRKDETDHSQKEQTQKMRGLYRYVNVSVHTLNLVIIVGIAAIVLLIVYGVNHNGYTVVFDANGGSDVANQECMYGDLLTEPEPPSREGYLFEGWYTDENCTVRWNFDVDVVNGGMELYAGWKEEQD